MEKPKRTVGSEAQKLSEKLKDEQLLRDELISKADALIDRKFSDESLDKENEKQFILQYAQHNPKRRYIRNGIKPYMKKFPIEFYELIYKLHGWPTDNDKLYNRPGIVGKWTNEIIYNRYPGGILKMLQNKNPYNENGIRLYKHFQWLTEIGETELNQFIADAIRVMQKCSYWSQFKRSFAKEFGMPYQGDLFEA